MTRLLLLAVLATTSLACAQGRRTHGDLLGDIRLQADFAAIPRRGNPGMSWGVAGLPPGPEAAVTLRDLRLRFVRLDAPSLASGDLEPLGEDGRFRFAALDRLMKDVGAAGIGEVWLCLRTRSARSCVSFNPSARGWPAFALKPEAEQGFAALVAALVERYDRDGKDDMEGLSTRLAYLEFNPEPGWRHGFVGSSKDYLKILELGSEAAHGASKHLKVFPGTLHLGTLFDSAPKNLRKARARAKQKPYAEVNAFQQAIFERSELYDGLVLAGHSHYYALYGALHYYEQELQRRAKSKPLYIAPLMSGSLRLPFGNYRRDPKRTSAGALVNAIRKGRPDALRWWRTHQAAEVTRKLCVSLHAGVKGVAVGHVGPWPFASHIPPSENLHPLCNLIHFEAPWSTKATKSSPPMGKTLAFEALRRLRSPLAEFRTIELTKGPPNTWAFMLAAPGGTQWLLWAEDGVGQGPKRQGMAVSVTLDVPSGGEYLVTHLCVPEDAASPRERVVKATGKVLELSVEETPVLVERL